MNGDNTNDAPNQPVNLDNGDTPYAAIFATTTPPAATAAAAYNIAHYAHFLSFGLKLDTEVFSKGNIKNMYDKETFDTKPVPDVPDSDTPESAAQHAGSTDSNYPYSLRNCTPPPTPPTQPKTIKISWRKLMIKLQSNPPLPPTHLTLIPLMLPPKIMAPPTPFSHIHREIANLPPTQPIPRKTRKRGKWKLMIKLQSTPTLPTMHLSLITPMLLPKMLDSLTTIPHIHWEIANPPPTPSPWKTIKKKENTMAINTNFTPPPDPLSPNADNSNTYAQDSVSTESYIPYLLRN